MTENGEHWDYCHIEFKLRNKGEELTYGGFRQMWLVFLAYVTGPDKNYQAGESTEIPIPANIIGTAFIPQQANPSHVNIHQNLLNKLGGNGWELLPDKGSTWWERRLRRPVRPPKSKSGWWKYK